MFLDDKIVKTVLENKPQDYDSQFALINDIVKMCNTELSSLLNSNLVDNNIIPSTKKVCNIWDSAAKILEKKGYPLLAIGGFRAYLLSKPDIAETLTRLGF